MSLIELKNINKAYHLGDAEQVVLNDVNLSVNHGELISIMGQSGSGKSTLMNIIGLLDKSDKGEYLFEGESVASLSKDELAVIRNQKIGFVFQAFFLLPRMNAWQNVALPLLYRDVSESEQKELALEMLDRVGMSRHAYHKPNQLSGGQQQRVAIARALVGKPSFILADEPTGALDPHTGQEILELFIGLNETVGTTLMIITHDTHVAAKCRRQVKMVDGKILEE